MSLCWALTVFIVSQIYTMFIKCTTVASRCGGVGRAGRLFCSFGFSGWLCGAANVPDSEGMGARAISLIEGFVVNIIRYPCNLSFDLSRYPLLLSMLSFYQSLLPLLGSRLQFRLSMSSSKLSRFPFRLSMSPSKLSMFPFRLSRRPFKLSMFASKLSRQPFRLSMSPSKLSTCPLWLSRLAFGVSMYQLLNPILC
jgi:hypothetical protein